MSRLLRGSEVTFWLFGGKKLGCNFPGVLDRLSTAVPMASCQIYVKFLWHTQHDKHIVTAHCSLAIKQSLQFSSEAADIDVTQVPGEWQADCSINEDLPLRNCDRQMWFAILAQPASDYLHIAVVVSQCWRRRPTYGRLSLISMLLRAAIWMPVPPAWSGCFESVASGDYGSKVGVRFWRRLAAGQCNGFLDWL